MDVSWILKAVFVLLSTSNVLQLQVGITIVLIKSTYSYFYNSNLTPHRYTLGFFQVQKGLSVVALWDLFPENFQYGSLVKFENNLCASC